MKVNKYLPLGFVYFFINPVGLPFGLLYTTLLTPFFYVWMILKGRRLIVLRFSLILLPFIIFHLSNGVHIQTYIVSLLLLLSVYIFGYAFHTLLRQDLDLENIFRKLLVLNLAFTTVALMALATSFRHYFWNDWTFSFAGVAFEMIPRLKMLTYEPSYYAMLLVPIFFFYFTKFLTKYSQGDNVSKFLMITIPMGLSFSFGVISGIILSIGLFSVINLSLILTSKKLFYSFLAISVFALIIIVPVLLFYEENPFLIRLSAFISGEDQSGRGRTIEAFSLALQIAKEKSLLWGIGPGQLKIIGDPIIREFYGYTDDYGQVSIPNAVAETLALYGLIGVGFRLLIQIYFFFKTRVLNNYYRTFLFLYIFIYQFTGSFTTNIAEYVIWILAFTNAFPQFDKHRVLSKQSQSQLQSL